jgi:hypothetical protein
MVESGGLKKKQKKDDEHALRQEAFTVCILLG